MRLTANKFQDQILATGEDPINGFSLPNLAGAVQYSEGLKLRKDLSPIIYIRIRNLIMTGEFVAKSALGKRASRRAHFREDFPNL